MTLLVQTLTNPPDHPFLAEILTIAWSPRGSNTTIHHVCPNTKSVIMPPVEVAHAEVSYLVAIDAEHKSLFEPQSYNQSALYNLCHPNFETDLFQAMEQTGLTFKIPTSLIVIGTPARVSGNIAEATKSCFLHRRNQAHQLAKILHHNSRHRPTQLRDLGFQA